MKTNYIIYGTIALFFIVAYNCWLDQRDQILFEKYTQPVHVQSK